MFSKNIHGSLLALTKQELELLDSNRDLKHIFKNHFERHFFQDNYIFIEKQARFIDVPLHTHEFIELAYVYQGEMRQVVNGKDIVLRQGEILLLNQFAKHKVEAASHNDIILNIIINPHFFSRLLTLFEDENKITEFILASINSQRRHGEHIHFKVGDNPKIQEAICNVIEEIFSDSMLKPIRVHCYLGLLVTELLANMESSDYHVSMNYNESLAVTVLRYIEENYRDASLKSISSKLNLPNYRISKLLKEFTGKNFSEILVQKRLEKVAYLLKSTNYPVVDIINMCGYENASHCYKLFKEKYEVSPKSFRDNC
jgi:AraC-like DNA-binding protein/mannose-6-phosphate isomerase-like protein (cupin superfamily)